MIRTLYKKLDFAGIRLNVHGVARGDRINLSIRVARMHRSDHPVESTYLKCRAAIGREHVSLETAAGRQHAGGFREPFKTTIRLCTPRLSSSWVEQQ